MLHLEFAFFHIKAESKDFIKDWAPGQGVEDYVLSATIEATKPGKITGGSCC